MNERQFQTYLVNKIRYMKAGVTVTRVNNVPGFPDLLLLRGDRYSLIELKYKNAVFTKHQKMFFKKHLSEHSENKIHVIVKKDDCYTHMVHYSKEYSFEVFTESYKTIDEVIQRVLP